MSTVQARMWCFTLFATAEGSDDATAIPEAPPLVIGEKHVVEFIYQMEIATGTGRHHWQGFVRFKSPVRRSYVKTVLGSTHVHVEKVIDPAAARKYCQKDDTRAPGFDRVIAGDRGHQGKRSDLDEIVAAVTAKCSLKRIAEDHPKAYVKFHKGIAALRSAIAPAQCRDVQVFSLIGPTGCGKTRFVVDRYPVEVRNTVFDSKTPWFDGYDQHPVMLIDEFGPGQMASGFLKKLLDRYDVSLPVKGASVPMCAKLVFLTSNYDVHQWYPNTGAQDHAALERRMTIVDCTVDGWQGRLEGMIRPLDLPEIEEEAPPLLREVPIVPPPVPTLQLSPAAMAMDEEEDFRPFHRIPNSQIWDISDDEGF